MKSSNSAYEFLDISGMHNYQRYAGKIGNIVTTSGKASFKYLLYDNDKSYAFAIRSGDDLVGFQGFVYKPVMLDDELIPAFRSEFTIATPELRGTGVFPEFYRQAMQVIVDRYQKVYIWGQTRHKGFTRYGYEMRSGYSFYQVFSRAFGSRLKSPQLYNQRFLNPLLVTYSRLNPLRFVAGRRQVNVADQLSYESFRAHESRAIKGRLRLFLDEAQFKWRYADNPFEKYEYWTYRDSLVIVRCQDNMAHIVDIQAASVAQYLAIAAALVRRYETVVFFGNIFAQYRLPFFWAHLLLGFTPFLFGGSYVEYNKYSPAVRLNDNPLFLSWSFGVGES